MRPKSHGNVPQRQRRVTVVLLTLLFLFVLTVAHAWLTAYVNAAATARAVKIQDADSTASSPLARVDPHLVRSSDADAGEFTEPKPFANAIAAFRDKVKHAWQKSRQSTERPIPPHLNPPPVPYQAPPTYDPASVRPTRRVTMPPPKPSKPPVTSEGPLRSQEPMDHRGATPRKDGEDDESHSSSSGVAFFTALNTFYDNLLIKEVGGNPEQPSRSFTDINGTKGKGVALPHDPTFQEREENWRACDPRNASFSGDRDALCQQYLGNLNNMRYIKAMPSRLLQGRTIKVKIQYAHNNIQTIVKIAQRKFTYEAVSEYLAFTYDRALQFHRVPTTVFLPLPLDYLRAATSYSPLLSQWFHRFVVLYNYTSANFQRCTYHDDDQRALVTEDDGGAVLCSMVTSQLWMKDVHPALETFLGLNFEFDEAFARKYYVPGHELFATTKKARLRAIGELLDRSIFDFIIGNTDRGMNDHNNFVYGGCSRQTECTVEKPENRILGLAKYAYIDHGSSFHSHKEPMENPFFGDVGQIKICRYRKSTAEHLRRFASRPREPTPLFTYVDTQLPTAVYKVAHESVLRKTQTRLDKVVQLIDRCLDDYPSETVFSLKEYDEIRIAEEDETLGDEWD